MTATTDIAGLIERLRIKGTQGEWDSGHNAALDKIEEAFALSVGAEPVGWQWSDFSGKWYTVDTANWHIEDQKMIAQTAAEAAEGRVRALVPASALSTAIRERDEARAERVFLLETARAAEALASQARADATSAQARIAALEALIEAQHGDVVVRTAKLLYEKDDAIADAQARIAELEKALEPFAVLADDYLAEDMNLDDQQIMAGRIQRDTSGRDPAPRVVFGDFRFASSILKEDK